MKARMSTCATALTFFVSLSAPVCLSAQHTRYKLIDIGTLGGPTAYEQAFPGSQLLNNAGVVAGTADITTPDPNTPNCVNQDCFLSHAFRWRGGMLTDLGTIPGGTISSASSINAHGWIAGGSTTAEIDPFNGACGLQPLCPQFHGVLWKHGAIIDIGTLGKGLESNTRYVNNSGAVVGYSTIDTSSDPFSPLGAPTHAFIWRNGAMRDLGTLGGPDSFPSLGCDNQRSDLVTGSSLIDSPNPVTHAFLWNNGKMTDIPTLGGTVGFGQCANNRGQVIGQSNLPDDVGCPDACAQHAFFWENGTLTDLGTLGGSFSQVIWLNNAGDAVGGALTSGDEEFHATLWRNGQITDLNPDGDCFSNAWAINSKGQIVGQSFNCDTGTLQTVVWDRASVIKLNVPIPGPTNINDRGEIAGVGLPPGCEETDFCGHEFLLIPCASGQGCEGNDDINVRTGSPVITKRAVTSAERREMTRKLVAQLRARLAERYHIPRIGAPKN